MPVAAATWHFYQAEPRYNKEKTPVATETAFLYLHFNPRVPLF